MVLVFQFYLVAEGMRVLTDGDIEQHVADLDAWYGEQPDPVVPELPAWLLEEVPAGLVPPGCADLGCWCWLDPDVPCGALPEIPLPHEESPVRWAVPGVWDDEPTPATLPPVGAAVAGLQSAVSALADVDPASIPGAQALVETAALQAVVQQLRVLLLPRLEDVSSRKLFALAGYHGVSGWQRAVAPDAVASDRTLAGRLPCHPVLQAAVTEGRVSLTSAARVATALRKVRPYVDAPDGLIDGQPGEQVVSSVVDNTVDLVCRARGGVADDDPFLQQLTDDAALVHLAGGSQQTRVEGAFVLLATHVPAAGDLAGALEEQVFALIPNLLEQQQQSAEARRGASLRRNSDGSWEVQGRLTPECGERLFTALAAEARRDPANPVDTLARQHAREAALVAAGLEPVEHANSELGPEGVLQPLPEWERAALTDLAQPGPAAEHAAQTEDLQALGLGAAEADEAARLVPRCRSRRVHDALNRLLGRYLEAGLGGVHDKVPVQVAVIVPSGQVEQRPGALPARGPSGRPLARSLLRRWWGDSQVTLLILGQGWVPLGVTHSLRTITAKERLALHTQWGHRCAGADCCPGTPDPLIPLVAHHVEEFSKTGETSLGETLPICERLHQDLHLGKKAVRLRDGRLITEDGYLTDG